MTTTAPPDLGNIQGDILIGIPKKTQTYFFFQIQGDPSLFRKALVDVVPHIKSASQVQKDRDAIKDHKRKGDGTLLPMTGTQIAFSNAGLKKMGISGVATPGNPSPDPFIEGQFKDAQNIGDAGTGDQENFVPAWDPAFGNANIDGVIFVGGDSHQSVDKEMHKIKLILGPSVKEVIHIRGDTRPGKESGHEHFGFLDGISNPTITDLADKHPLPGPLPIDKANILTGHDSSSPNPPPVFVDGSFLAFRYLFQLVPEFNQFLQNHPIKEHGLTPKEGSELRGARMVGRWKSGAPVDLTPIKDDPKLGKDPQRNNNFFYHDELTNGDQSRCPYSAHTRKTNPRADFTEHNLSAALDTHRIMRRGIQFGPEVTDDEARHHRTTHGRGLLFVCYQSSISNGFQFVQKSWANAPGFLFNAVQRQPDGTLKPIQPGLDSIIGQDMEKARGVVGTDPGNPENSIDIPRFIAPRGGEYFFSPSISALRDIIALGVNIG